MDITSEMKFGKYTSLLIHVITSSAIYRNHHEVGYPLQWSHNGATASQITSLTIVCSTVYSGAAQSKHHSSASLAFERGIHRPPSAQMASNAENVSISWRHHIIVSAATGTVLTTNLSMLYTWFLTILLIIGLHYSNYPAVPANVASLRV